MAEFSEDELVQMLAMADAEKSKASPKWTKDEIFNRLDEIIIGNEKYKHSLAGVLSSYLSPRRNRDHTLVIGPSGSGKTYLLEKVLPLFEPEVPSQVIAAGGMVAAGFSGMGLKDNIRHFFKSKPNAAKQSILVIDEFDKLSTFAGKDPKFSADIQSELLTLVQGERDVEIDTRNTLWIFLGAFAYTEEMKSKNPKLTKTDLIRYGFKEELLGRIQNAVMTDIPELSDMLKRLNIDLKIAAFRADMQDSGFEISWSQGGFLALAMAVKNSPFGMRVVGDVTSILRMNIGTGGTLKGPVEITPEMVKEALSQI